jgi:peptidoglycan hydrolase FlgJ
MNVNLALPLAPKAADQKAELGKAAKQFEAIFVRQMLAAARKASLGEGLFDNSAVEQFQSMQDSQIADLVSERGGLGLGKTIEQQLSGHLEGKKP